jgi:hypothetical protein
VALAVLAASGAGLASLAWHPPGSPSRAELTAEGDAVLGVRLDLARAQLADVAADVELLAAAAKSALGDVASDDPTRIDASLELGNGLAAAIEAKASTLRASLVDLPGAEPDAAVRYGNATLARRSAILAAIEAASGVAGNWQTVAARARETAHLTALISQHDTTVLNATEQGRNGEFKKAVGTVDQVIGLIDEITALRVRLVAAQDSVLDEWINRSKAWDSALRNLYKALVKSRGRVTVEVQSARREEQLAFQQLPADRRAIVVIVSEVTRNGLTQAVLTIDEASARLDEAIAGADEAGQQPSASPS